MKDQWHLNKEVTVSQLILMAMIIATGIAAWFGMDTRVTVLETFPLTHSETHENFNEMQRAMFTEVSKQLDLLRDDLVRSNINSLAEIRENRKIIIEELRK